MQGLEKDAKGLKFKMHFDACIVFLYCENDVLTCLYML